MYNFSTFFKLRMYRITLGNISTRPTVDIISCFPGISLWPLIFGPHLNQQAIQYLHSIVIWKFMSWLRNGHLWNISQKSMKISKKKMNRIYDDEIHIRVAQRTISPNTRCIFNLWSYLFRCLVIRPSCMLHNTFGHVGGTEWIKSFGWNCV